MGYELFGLREESQSLALTSESTGGFGFTYTGVSVGTYAEERQSAKSGDKILCSQIVMSLIPK